MDAGRLDERISVLVVDDNAGLLAALDRALARAGLFVETAPDAARALALARARAFDAAVIDLRLPDRSGLDLVRAMRAEGIDVPAAIYTGYPDVVSRVEASALGVVYLIKGRDGSASLLDTIRRLADRREPEAPARAFDDVLREIGALRGARHVEAVTRRRWARRLAVALAEPAVSFAEFATGAAVLRALVDAALASGSALVRARIEFERLPERARIAESAGLERLMRPIEATGRYWRSVTDAGAAAGDRSRQVNDAVRHAFGWSWRQALGVFAMRQAVLMLAHTDEHVAQIAFQLHYEFPSAFNRDFTRLLGLGPSAFRRLVGEAD